MLYTRLEIRYLNQYKILKYSIDNKQENEAYRHYLYDCGDWFLL